MGGQRGGPHRLVNPKTSSLLLAAAGAQLRVCASTALNIQGLRGLLLLGGVLQAWLSLRSLLVLLTPSLGLASGSRVFPRWYAPCCSTQFLYCSWLERLDRGDCSAAAQSSSHGSVEGDRRRLGVPGSGLLSLALLLLRLDPARHPT